MQFTETQTFWTFPHANIHIASTVYILNYQFRCCDYSLLSWVQSHYQIWAMVRCHADLIGSSYRREIASTFYPEPGDARYRSTILIRDVEFERWINNQSSTSSDPTSLLGDSLESSWILRAGPSVEGPSKVYCVGDVRPSCVVRGCDVDFVVHRLANEGVGRFECLKKSGIFS